jgi:hypothetical protein
VHGLKCYQFCYKLERKPDDYSVAHIKTEPFPLFRLEIARTGFIVVLASGAIKNVDALKVK